MADTAVQQEVANWVRGTHLPGVYGQAFTRCDVALRSGGVHEFAAVSEDGKAIGTISTSRATTTGSKLGVGKLSKVRADLYFLLLAPAMRRFVVAVDPTMFALLKREQDEFGRIPSEIDVLFAELPAELRDKLANAQQTAAEEVGG